MLFLIISRQDSQKWHCINTVSKLWTVARKSEVHWCLPLPLTWLYLRSPGFWKLYAPSAKTCLFPSRCNEPVNRDEATWKQLNIELSITYMLCQLQSAYLGSYLEAEAGVLNDCRPITSRPMRHSTWASSVSTTLLTQTVHKPGNLSLCKTASSGSNFKLNFKSCQRNCMWCL